MIRADHVRRAFAGRVVVDDVDLRVDSGEVVGLLGPNGAGKTTTMRMVLGLLRPTAGTVEVTGPVGYLPEVFAAYDSLPVRRYLAHMARLKRVSRTDVGRVLHEAGIADLARRPVGRLSKGQRQRVGLAQALLGGPRTVVLDEPTQGLDPGQVVDVRRVVRDLAAGGAAVLLSTHLLAEAAAVCDRVVVLVGGRVVAEERPGEAPDLEARFLRLVGEAQLGAGGGA